MPRFNPFIQGASESQLAMVNNSFSQEESLQSSISQPLMYEDLGNTNNEPSPTWMARNTLNRQFLIGLYESSKEYGCKMHGRTLEYVCCTCKKLRCNLCLSQTCHQGRLGWRGHDILSFRNYLARLKRENKDRVDPKIQQHHLSNYKQNASNKIKEFRHKIQQINAQSLKCIEQLELNCKMVKSALQMAISGEKRKIERQIQIRQQKIIQQKMLKQILECETEKKAIEMVVRDWSIIKNCIEKNRPSNKLSQMEEQPDRQNSYLIMVQSLKLTMKQLEKTRKALLRQRTQKCASSEKSLAKSSSNLNLISPDKKQNPRRSFLGSVTNLVNRQMNKSNAKAVKDQMETFRLYGGNENCNFTEIYNPWRQNKRSKLAVNLGETPSHTDFGSVKIKRRRNMDLIVLGGYINQQITDCIFRIDFEKKKKELIGRLDEPLAQFGCESLLSKKEDGQTKIETFACGGINQKGYPVSSFTALRFSENSSSFVGRVSLPRMEQPRHSLTLTAHRSLLFAIGGMDCENKALKTVASFCHRKKAWMKIGDLCCERSGHGAVSLKSGLYVVGGWNGQNYLRSVEHYHESKKTFEIVMEMSEGRQKFGLMPRLQSNEILLLGGKSYSVLSSCECINLRSKKSGPVSALECPKFGFCSF